jgi:2-desacetyl-2-hydroxyethyl bacteriochlorophyllide A dehydrogenase
MKIGADFMIAARFYAPDQPLALETVGVPQVDQDEVLVEVRACGLCGSDVHILEGNIPTGRTPITLGHEIAGVIASVGREDCRWHVGDRVIINCIRSCGICPNCESGRYSICYRRKIIGIHLDGGFAQYVKVKSQNLIALPESISYDQGALLADAVATPYHALKSRGKVISGQSMAIFGIGGIGVHAVMLARILGAKPIIALDISRSRLLRAQEFGADVSINVNKEDPIRAIKEATRGAGAIFAIDCVGSGQTVNWCMQSVANGGYVVLVGLSREPVALSDVADFVNKEITVMGSSGFDSSEITELVALVSSGELNLSKSITEILDLDRVNEGLSRLANHSDDIVRLIVAP